MKVVRTIEAFLPNLTGPATQAWEISAALERRGVSSPVCTSRLDVPDSCPAEERLGPVQVFRLGAPFRLGRYAPTPGLPCRLKGADLVHTHNFRHAQCDLAALWAAARGVPWVVHAHGGLAGFLSHGLSRAALGLYGIYDALVLRPELARAAAVCVSSEEERREALAAGLPERKVVLVSPGVRAPEAMPVRGADPERLRLLFVGRLCARRRPEALIESLALLPGAFLTLVGAPTQMSALERPLDLDSLRRLAEERGVSGRVRFTGALYGEDLERAYAEADLFVYPTRYENFGFPLLEAAARGLPLVSTRVGVAHDILKEGETGCFTSGEPGDLAGKIRDLAGLSPWAAAARHARESVLPRFSWEAAGERCHRLYEAVLGGASPAG